MFTESCSRSLETVPGIITHYGIKYDGIHKRNELDIVADAWTLNANIGFVDIFMFPLILSFFTRNLGPRFLCLRFFSFEVRLWILSFFSLMSNILSVGTCYAVFVRGCGKGGFCSCDMCLCYFLHISIAWMSYCMYTFTHTYTHKLFFINLMSLHNWWKNTLPKLRPEKIRR